jgi:hypothetical protein
MDMVVVLETPVRELKQPGAWSIPITEKPRFRRSTIPPPAAHQISRIRPRRAAGIPDFYFQEEAAGLHAPKPLPKS